MSNHYDRTDPAEVAWLAYRDRMHALGAPRRQLRKREFLAGWRAQVAYTLGLEP